MTTSLIGELPGALRDTVTAVARVGVLTVAAVAAQMSVLALDAADRCDELADDWDLRNDLGVPLIDPRMQARVERALTVPAPTGPDLAPVIQLRRPRSAAEEQSRRNHPSYRGPK